MRYICNTTRIPAYLKTYTFSWTILISVFRTLVVFLHRIPFYRNYWFNQFSNIFLFLFRSDVFRRSYDFVMSVMASQITILTIYSGADQREHQSSASLAFVRGIHRWPVNSPHKGPVTRKMFPFDDIIMMELDAETYPGDADEIDEKEENT